MTTFSRTLLRLEGVFVLAAAVTVYGATTHSWWLFAAALLAPDLFMTGYWAGPRVGALLYNTGHTYLVPIGLAAAGYLGASPLAGALALIWVAHIGMDRALGFGLKSPSGFSDTHLSEPDGSAQTTGGRPAPETGTSELPVFGSVGTREIARS
ncbi:MAG: DUF4260 domain-containing protein [Salinibacter sp.]|uniref:DUF4260 domain-containing protein n=1 Tax=Salinibacter sp. TaxID=2065818 RepID=UPI0035D4B02F